MTQTSSHLDKSRLKNLADEIWKSAERLRGKFKAHEYQNVILPQGITTTTTVNES